MTSSRHQPMDVSQRIVLTASQELSADRSITYAQCGTGRDCLVIHGTLMTLEDMWLGPVPALAQYFRVTAIDRPGHGLSRRQRLVDASPWRQATLIHDFAVAAGLHQPILVGHSYGGTVALAYAIQFPEDVAGVVALAPVCMPELRADAIVMGPRGIPFFGDGLTSALGSTVDPVLLPLMWQAIFLPQTMPEPFRAAFPFALAAQFDQMIAEGEDAAVLMPAVTAMAMRYTSCKVPARILGGTADIVANNAVQGQVAAALMPNGSFKWLIGMGHMLHHFEQSRVVEEAFALL